MVMLVVFARRVAFANCGYWRLGLSLWTRQTATQHVRQDGLFLLAL